MDTASSLDPTGVLNATTAAVRLVGTVLNVAPQVKRTIDNKRGSRGPGELGGFAPGEPGDADVTGASTSSPLPATAAQIQSLALQRVDPEKETRAYETVNYVLRTIGSRILEARMVNMEALAKALTAATSHIEVKLFSGETNRLFQSLARKLNDVNLVNSVFTSIYLVGFLTAEISSSLPNYKREYPALGPLLVQQMMKVAIGEDAFRENLTANLNAYQTVATTAGLLRPTDIGYSIFPDFPSFSPTKYSTKSILDRSSHKSALDKLVKHFDEFGFPQPLQGRDVGPIRDWRFLSGDTNSRAYEVDKADKQIGTNFGRVLYWLICSAHRMPSGMGVVAYYDQHIALIRFLGPRFGYRVLNAGGDLNVSGPHLKLNKKLRAVFDTWVIIMPSETLIAERQKASQMTAQTPGMTPVSNQPVVAASPSPQQAVTGSPPPQKMSPQVPQNAGSSVVPQPGISGRNGTAPSVSSESSSQHSKPQPGVAQAQPTASNAAGQQLAGLEHLFRTAFLPSCHQFTTNPPPNVEVLKKEYFKLSEGLQSAVLFKIDAIDPGNDMNARMKRKGLVEEVQTTMARLDAVYREASKVSSPPSRPASMASLPSLKPAVTEEQSTDTGPIELADNSISNQALSEANLNSGGLPAATLPIKVDTNTSGGAPPHLASPVSISPPASTNVASPISETPPQVSPPITPMTAPSIAPSLASRPSVVKRKKAPLPPKRIMAKALYDHEPDEDDDEALAFAEGDMLEIVEKNATLEEDGWCRARIKGEKKIGLAPLDYLEELPNQPAGPPPRISRLSSNPTTTPIIEQSEQQAGSSLDSKIDINVSSASQIPLPTPNATSLATQPSNRPSIGEHLVNVLEASLISAPELPPPSYAAATSQVSIVNEIIPPVQSHNSTSSHPSVNSSSQPSVPPAIQNPGQPSLISSLNSGPNTSPSGKPPTILPAAPLSVPPAQSSPPVNTASPTPPPNQLQMSSDSRPPMRPPMGNRPPNQPYAGMDEPPYIGPGYPMGSGGPNRGIGVHGYIAIAGAATGLAQAGATIYAAQHGNNNNSSSGNNNNNGNGNGNGNGNDQPGGQSHNQSQNESQQTTNIYNENNSNNHTTNAQENSNNQTATSNSNYQSTETQETSNSQATANNNDSTNINNQTSNQTAIDNSNNQSTATATNDNSLAQDSTATANIEPANSLVEPYSAPTYYPLDSDPASNNASSGADSNVVAVGSSENTSTSNYPPDVTVAGDSGAANTEIPGDVFAAPTYYPPDTSVALNNTLTADDYNLDSTYYPPETSSAPFDYSMPFVPANTTATPDYSLNSTYTAPNDSTATPVYGLNSYSQAPATASIDAAPSSGSGPSSDPSTYATAPATDMSQYDYSQSTGNADPSAVSPFAASSVPAAGETSQTTFDFGFSSDPVSPLAGLSTSPPLDQAYGYSSMGTQDPSVAVSPFASMAPDSMAGYSTSGQTDSTTAVSPFASMALSESSTTMLGSDPSAATTTSPFASLATADTTATDSGYFGSPFSASEAVASETATGEVVSPFAGLATSGAAADTTATSGYDSVNVTTTTTTEIDYSSGGGGGGWEYVASSSSNYGFTDYADYGNAESYCDF